jgi:hypothetical protein
MAGMPWTGGETPGSRSIVVLHGGALERPVLASQHNRAAFVA